MKIDRAREIIDLPYLVNVHFHGIPVYLQEINSNEKTAIVFPLDNMEHEESVKLDQLNEEGPFN